MTTPQKENNRGLQAKVFTIAIAIILSASVIPFIYKASTTLAESRNDLKDKHERNAENFLLECQQLAKEGAYEVAIEKILTIKPKTLKPSLRNKWYIAITNIFYSKAKNYPQKRHSAINQALTFAQKGIILSQDPEVQHNLTFIKAELYILNEQWTAAIENLEILDTSTSNPMKRWGIRLKTAECLTQLKKYTYALKILESIIDETDEEDIWAKATFLHANLLWTNINHINSPQI
ncbi:MAG: hypothetical protein HRT88_06455 [Lentisphaeraceae bacterium]|nr:hypothetical protein [Lentisphaeraceae bacterium]